MFDTLQKPVYTLEQASQIAEEAAARALKSFVAQFAPGIGPAPHLENRIPPQNVHPSELPKITLTVKDMADWLGISMPKAYELVRTPGFPAMHVGRKVLVNKDMLVAWMAEQSAPKGV